MRDGWPYILLCLLCALAASLPGVAGMIGADVRPDWQEREGRESLTGQHW
jgi:hypothetical protein